MLPDPVVAIAQGVRLGLYRLEPAPGAEGAGHHRAGALPIGLPDELPLAPGIGLVGASEMGMKFFLTIILS